jgi:hypothetical protein
MDTIRGLLALPFLVVAATLTLVGAVVITGAAFVAHVALFIAGE